MTTLFNTTQTNSHSNEPSDSNSRGSSSLKSTENEKKRKIPLHKITNSANVMTGDRGVPDKYSKPDSTDMGDRKDPPVETKSAQGLSSFSKTASKAGKNMKANEAPPIRFQSQASKVGRSQKRSAKRTSVRKDIARRKAVELAGDARMLKSDDVMHKARKQEINFGHSTSEASDIEETELMTVTIRGDEISDAGETGTEERNRNKTVHID